MLEMVFPFKYSSKPLESEKLKALFSYFVHLSHLLPKQKHIKIVSYYINHINMFNCSSGININLSYL